MSRQQGHLGNGKAQARLKAQQRDAQRQREADMRAVLSTPEGRRFYWRVLDGVCGLFGGTFTGNSQTFHLEGRRSVGIDLMQAAQRTCPELYVQALQEALTAQQEEALHRRDAESTPDEDTL